MASFTKLNCFVADLANKVHNLGADALKVMLTNTSPSAANLVRTDISEIAAGSGYAAGGLAVAIASSSQTGGTYKLLPSADPVLTASGTVGPFRYAVLYNASAASGNLIGWWDRGTSITLASADTFTVGLDLANGVLQLS
ncbi:MAG TPA: hypothetical protein VHC39_16365 [Rhizomicrobium sp.]|nr:hypothetical protein [Rhizomicrobium sp.]